MQIGRYQIVEEVARGGMGVLYKARDPQGRIVALKTLRVESQTAKKRFALEARGMAELVHPNVARFYEAGEHQGQPFLAMEFVDGRSLDDRLSREGPLPLEAVQRIGLALCEALTTVHARGMLHRDLKPANVLENVAGRIVLTDFGLVRDEATSQTRLTAQGGYLGTPGFWAPEQARGRLDALGPHSDVYGLAATLYALLTGDPPRGGRTLPDVIAQLEAPVEPVRTRRPEIPRYLDDTLARCLDPEPAQRPSLAELGAALRSQPQQTEAPPAFPWIQAVAVLAAAVLALTVGWLVADLASQPTPPASADAPPTADPPAADAKDTPADPLPAVAKDTPPEDSPPADREHQEKRLALPAPRTEHRVILRATGGHHSMVTRLEVDSESARLLTGTLSGEIRLWDSRTGAHLDGWPAGGRSSKDPSVLGVAFGPDRSVLAITANALYSIPASGRAIERRFARQLSDLCVDPERKHVAICGAEGLLLWPIEFVLNGEAAPSAAAPGPLTRVEFHPRGEGGLAIGPQGGWRWDASGAGEPVALANSEETFAELAFSPDGAYVATLTTRTSQLTLYAWPSLEQVAQRTVFTPPAGAAATEHARSLAFTPEGTQIYTVGGGRGARTWAVPELEPQPNVLRFGFGSWVDRVRIDAQGVVYVAGNDALLMAHSRKTGKALWPWALRPWGRNRRTGPDKQGLSWLDESGDVLVLNTERGVTLFELAQKRQVAPRDQRLRDCQAARGVAGNLALLRSGRVTVCQTGLNADGQRRISAPQALQTPGRVLALAAHGKRVFVASRAADPGAVAVSVFVPPQLAPVGTFNALDLGSQPRFGQAVAGADTLWLLGSESRAALPLLPSAKARLVEQPASDAITWGSERQRVLWLEGNDWHVAEAGKPARRGTFPRNSGVYALSKGRVAVNLVARVDVFDLDSLGLERSLELPRGEIVASILESPDGTTLYVWTFRGALLAFSLQG